MRTYRVQEVRPNKLPPIQHTYKGFNRSVGNASWVALVACEDSVEVFALDDPAAALLELERYLNQGENGSLVGVFERRI